MTVVVAAAGQHSLERQVVDIVGWKVSESSDLLVGAGVAGQLASATVRR